MVWHIFRKDWKLLRWMAVGVALLNAAGRAIVSSYGPFWNPQSPLSAFTSMLENIAMVATAVMIVLAVQEDAIPGLRQDWLVRPIRRRDLLLSKVLFVALAMQGPIFAMEVAQCLAAGFPIGPSLSAPLSRSLWMLVAFDLPVLAFATLTRNLTQAAGAAIAAFVGYAFFFMFVQNLIPERLVNPTWVHGAAQALWGLLAVAAILALQYYRRQTTRARWVSIAAAVVWLALEFLPWRAAFAIEKQFSPLADAANRVQIAFDPSLGRMHVPPGARFTRWLGSRPADDTELWLPLRIDGVGEDEMLVGDSVALRFMVGGATIYAASQGGGQLSRGDKRLTHMLVFVPQEVYNRVKDQPLNLEIDFLRTLLLGNPAHAMPPAGSSQWLDGVGRCATRLAGNASVEMGCMAPGRGFFVLWTFPNQPPGAAGFGSFGGQPDFAPYFGRINGDSISRFRPPPGVDALAKDEQVMVRSFWPEAHFTRRLVIPDLRLSDWRPE